MFYPGEKKETNFCKLCCPLEDSEVCDAFEMWVPASFCLCALAARLWGGVQHGGLYHCDLTP